MTYSRKVEPKIICDSQKVSMQKVQIRNRCNAYRLCRLCCQPFRERAASAIQSFESFRLFQQCGENELEDRECCFNLEPSAYKGCEFRQLPRSGASPSVAPDLQHSHHPLAMHIIHLLKQRHKGWTPATCIHQPSGGSDDSQSPWHSLPKPCITVSSLFPSSGL